MRISDWSSDVCSSDLSDQPRRPGPSQLQPIKRGASIMLTIGDKFPAFNLKAVVSTDPKTAFTDITSDSDKGKWKIVFFWPKDFTFVCQTEIAAFGKLTAIGRASCRERVCQYV